MPPRRAKETSLPAVNSPVLFDYSEQLAILLFGQLMKWLRPLVRRGEGIPLADLKDALWAVREAWELHRDIARASGPQHLTAVPAEELDALTAGYDPLIDARDLAGDRVPPPAGTGRPERRPGPVGPGDDAALLQNIRQALAESRFTGEGYRKILGATALCRHPHLARPGAAPDATLDRNYLARAEQKGADVRPLHLVDGIEPMEGGYSVHYDVLRGGGSATAQRVVVAAGSLNSTECCCVAATCSGRCPGSADFSAGTGAATATSLRQRSTRTAGSTPRTDLRSPARSTPRP